MTSLALFAEKITNPFASLMSLLIEKNHNLSVCVSLSLPVGVCMLQPEYICCGRSWFAVPLGHVDHKLVPLHPTHRVPCCNVWWSSRAPIRRRTMEGSTTSVRSMVCKLDLLGPLRNLDTFVECCHIFVQILVFD
jgi:hypothetical protein